MPTKQDRWRERAGYVRVAVLLSPDDLARLDAHARARGLSKRPEALRDLIRTIAHHENDSGR